MKHRSLRAVWVASLVSVMASPACIPVAWVTPPMQLDVGTGLARAPRKNGPLEEGEVVSTVTSGALDARASVAPLAAIPGFEERLLDVSAGYGMRYLWTPDYIAHGPFIGASVMIPVTQIPGRRITLGTQLHALIGERRQGYSIVGNRVSGRVGFEWSSWEDGPFDECSIDVDGGFCGGGYGFGELAWAPYLEVSRAQMSRQSSWGLTAGITFRLPASAGAGLVFVNPCE